MATPEREDAIVRIGCGAVVGLVLGLSLVVGVVGFEANSIFVLVITVTACIVACALLGWRFGDRFFHSLHKWVRWF